MVGMGLEDSLALGIAVLGADDAEETASKMGEAVKLPFDDGVATGKISGDSTTGEGLSEGKPLKALPFLERWP